MLFAETVGKKTQFTSPNYNYKAHIQVKTDIQQMINTSQHYGTVVVQTFNIDLSSSLPIDDSVDHIQVELALWLFERRRLYITWPLRSPVSKPLPTP